MARTGVRVTESGRRHSTASVRWWAHGSRRRRLLQRAGLITHYPQTRLALLFYERDIILFIQPQAISEKPEISRTSGKILAASIECSTEGIFYDV